MTKTDRIAIIGAGLAGLACARALVDGGAAVTVFDKGRGPGGRIATRRSAEGGIDHGAVALSASRAADAPHAGGFAAVMAAAVADGAAVWWPPGQGWVGLPGNSAALRGLAKGIAVQQGAEVTGLLRRPDGWHLEGGPEGGFDQVILAIPQPQALALLSPFAPLQDRIAGARMRAVWTAMARLGQVLPLADDLIAPAEGPIEIALRNSAKPGRATGDAWVIHAGPDWTAAHLEHEKPEVAVLLLAAFFDSVGLTPVAPVALEGHRWRYGLTAVPLGQPFVRDADLGLAVCGDWCLGDRAGDAFASGTALAKALLQ